MDAERQKYLDALQSSKALRGLQEKQRKLMLEMERCLHFMLFWPEGYTVGDAKKNPKVSFHVAPGFGSGSLTMTLTREDGESHTFTFKTRATRRKTFDEKDAPEGWKRVKEVMHGNAVYLEPHDVLVGSFGRRVVELVESDVEGLDVSEIPHEAVVAVTKRYIERCF